MAKPERRGEVVGAVFTGLLIGILGARVGGGFVAEHFGWRWVYALSAVLVVGGVAAIWTRLPTLPSHYDGGYGALLRSTLQQVARFALLRRVMLIAALAFGTFCSFWTTLTFHLSGAPFHYGSDVIGLFGILAIAGASCKVFRQTRRQLAAAAHPIVTIGLIVVSIVLIQILPFSLCAFIVATLLLDVGMQATQVTNIAQIFTLDPAAYSRINTAFMTTVFFGGSIGSFCRRRGVELRRMDGRVLGNFSPVRSPRCLSWSRRACPTGAEPRGWRSAAEQGRFPRTRSHGGTGRHGALHASLVYTACMQA